MKRPVTGVYGNKDPILPGVANDRQQRCRQQYLIFFGKVKRKKFWSKWGQSCAVDNGAQPGL
jgi:hypothetical protein